MEVLIVVLAGLFAGHLMDLAGARFYTDEPAGGPLYRCRECRKTLRLIYAVPIIGYAISLGRCRDCGEMLPVSAIVLPLSGAMLSAASYVAMDESLAGGLLGAFFGTVFVALTLTDLERRLLPNRIVYPSILIAIAFCWAWPDSSFSEVLAGGLVAIAVAIGLFIPSLLFGQGAFGMGDVKMIVLIGFVVGLPSVIVGIFVGTLAAGVAALILVLTRLRSRRDYIPHGPFLALGAIVALFWGDELWDAYRN